MKIAIDMHGVIDAVPEFFRELTESFWNNGNDIHILTGATLKDGKIENQLNSLGIYYTKLFSIVDYHESIGTEIIYEENGPWMDGTLWDEAKGNYCKHHQIDFIIDDTLRYSKFTDCPFLHLNIIQKSNDL